MKFINLLNHLMIININMQNNISNYLESSVSKQFTDEGYVQNILPKILEFLQNDR